MKNTSFYFILFFLLFFQISNSQTLHALVFCNTLDPEIGTSSKKNHIKMEATLKTIASDLKYSYKEDSLSGNEFTIKNVIYSLDTLKIKSTDLIFMYICTHGAKSILDSTEFPQIKIPDTLLSVYKLYRKILLKKAKNVFTMVDACSNFEAITPQQIFVSGTLESDKKFIFFNRNKNQNKNQNRNVRILFSQNCDIIITAGHKGEKTSAGPNGSVFTNCFINTLNDYNISDSLQVNWKDFLTLCAGNTNVASGAVSETAYTPFWENTCDNNMLSSNNTNEIHISGVEWGVGDGNDSTMNFALSIDNKFTHDLDLQKALLQQAELERSNILHQQDSIKALYNVSNESIKIIQLCVQYKNISANKSKCMIQLIGTWLDIHSIYKVEYFLNVNSTNPIVQVTNVEDNFSYTCKVSENFPIKAKVYYKSGKVIDIYGEIKLQPNDNSSHYFSRSFF